MTLRWSGFPNEIVGENLFAKSQLMLIDDALNEITDDHKISNEDRLNQLQTRKKVIDGELISLSIMNEIKKNPYIWLISGCSSGFGREIALQALSAGDFVGVSSRNLKDVEDICKKYPKTALPIKLDVTNKR